MVARAPRGRPEPSVDNVVITNREYCSPHLDGPPVRRLENRQRCQGGRNPAYREEDGQRVMKQAEITVRVHLGRGAASATVWTCDLSHDYVSINADYRS